MNFFTAALSRFACASAARTDSFSFKSRSTVSSSSGGCGVGDNVERGALHGKVCGAAGVNAAHPADVKIDRKSEERSSARAAACEIGEPLIEPLQTVEEGLVLSQSLLSNPLACIEISLPLFGGFLPFLGNYFCLGHLRLGRLCPLDRAVVLPDDAAACRRHERE